MTDITADMIERACKAYHIGIYGYPCLITDMQRKGMEAAIREVLQLVEEAQTADTYRIKPLVWEKARWWESYTAKAGDRYVAVWLNVNDGVTWHLGYESGDKRGSYPTLEAAKAAAESHWRTLLLDSVLEEV